MNYSEEYKRKLRTPQEAVQVVKSGDWIDYTATICFPYLLDKALAERKEELYDVKVRGSLLFGPIEIVECDPERRHFIYNTWHCSDYERRLCDKGLCNYIPMIFRNVIPYYRHFLTVNVAMMCVTPMDKHGYFNLSGGAGVAKGILDKADIVILEVNENLPWINGGFDECIHISDVDYIVEGEHKDVAIPGHGDMPTEQERQIANNIIPYIPSGATLQLGIGSLPDTLGKLMAQSDLKDLGMHTELCSDAYLRLFEAGVLTNKKKTLHRGKGLTGMVIGSRQLYDWVDHNSGVMIAPLEYVNATETIAKNDNMISINNCIAVDLYGQICAESAGLRHISGTGGQLDYVTGAAMSAGGKAFICMTSTYTDHSGVVRSRIVPHFSGDIVTDPRSQSYLVCTEYGVVNLVGRTTWERAELLISIAHPDFRDGLIREAEKQKIWIKG